MASGQGQRVILSVASGKGGTGKTTLAVNLAAAVAASGLDIAFVDCDVEEPNGHLFLNPINLSETEVTVPVPRILTNRCTYCGDCAAACEFKALAVVSNQVLVFDDLCHSCGACLQVCPELAIEEIPRPIGALRIGGRDRIRFIEGRLNVGELQSPPVIAAAREKAGQDIPVIIDCPPGTACPAMEAVRNSDYCILVTEPTPFGLHDLRLMADMLNAIGIPHGVVINRSGDRDSTTEDFCRERNLDILMRIPDSRSIAERGSRGELLIDSLPELATQLEELFLRLQENIKA